MFVIGVRDLRSDYARLVEMITTHGTDVSPRGTKTRELQNCAISFDDARDCTFPTGIGRGVSPQVFAAEMMQWIGGFSDLTQLASVSSAFLRFTDDKATLYGAYGPRTSRSMARAVEVLASDHSSRQATVPIWRSDESMTTRDLPCTVSWSFMIRDELLHMTTFMRSNDVWTGVAYDVPIMGRICSAMAWALGVGVGTYTHHAQSLHIYETDIEKVAELEKPSATVEPPFFDAIDRDVSDDPSVRWQAITNWAMGASRSAPGLPDEFSHYGDLLKDSKRGEYFCTGCRYMLNRGQLCRCP